MQNLVFHIGHHKTGTTWLQSGLFSEHPDISLVSNWRTPWDDPFLRYLIRTSDRRFDAAHCRALLDRCLSNEHPQQTNINLVSAERLSGHPFSGGYDAFRLADRIHACFPNARVLFAIRNQVDMLLSAYKQIVKEGYPGKFQDFIRGDYWKSVAFSLDMYEYDLLVEKYHALFAPDRVLALIYENLKSDPLRYLERITTFFGIPSFVPSNTHSVENKGRGVVETAAVRFLNHFRKSELNPFPVVEVNRKLLHKLSKSKIIAMLAGSGRMAEGSDIEFIKRYYRDSNRRLMNLLNCELPDYDF